MKLVIDIPEMAYDAYKEWHKNNVATVEQSLIANGIPYEERPQGDLISREALKEVITANHYLLSDRYNSIDYGMFTTGIMQAIDNAPTVEERPQGEWIPIKYRPMTSEERKEFAEHYGIEYCDTLEEKAFDCPMPKDGQKILISTLWGVDIDVADNDIDGEGFICYGLEGNGDWSGVIAWQPLPEPYKEGGAEE